MVWLLSGLWHGAGWNFALWGLYFGAFLSAEKLIGRKWKERSFKIADVSANNDSNGGNRENMFLTCVRNIIEHGYVLLVVLFSLDRKSTRLNSSHIQKSRMPSSA